MACYKALRELLNCRQAASVKRWSVSVYVVRLQSFSALWRGTASKGRQILAIGTGEVRTRRLKCLKGEDMHVPMPFLGC